MSDQAARLLTLDRLGDWRLQVGIWGHAVIGDIIERDATVAERGGPLNCLYRGFWDRTRADMAGDMRDHGRGYEPVPDWFAFAHLPLAWIDQAFTEERLNDGCQEGS